MTYLKQKTNKLFYGKFPYKVNAYCKGINFLRLRDYEWILERTQGTSPYVTIASTHNVDRDNLRRFIILAHPYFDSFRSRLENNAVSFFLETKEQFDEVCKVLHDFITYVSEPESDYALEYLQSKEKIVLCDRYPHDLYRYKVSFRSLNENQKQKLLTWSKNYKETQVKFSKMSIEALERPVTYYWDNVFCHLDDIKHLTFLYLLIGSSIKKVEQFVLRSSINTVSQDQDYAKMDG